MDKIIRVIQLVKTKFIYHKQTSENHSGLIVSLPTKNQIINKIKKKKTIEKKIARRRRGQEENKPVEERRHSLCE